MQWGLAWSTADVVVHLLRPSADVDAVEHALDPLPVEHDVDARCAPAPPPSEIAVRGEPRRAPAAPGSVPMWKAPRLSRCTLSWSMIAPWPSDHLGDRVGQVVPPGAGVGLDDRRLAALPRRRQVARVTTAAGWPRRDERQQLDRPGEHRAASAVDEGAVAQEGRVERHERAVVRGVRRARPPPRSGCVARPGQAGDAPPAGSSRRRRQLGREAAVDEHQPGAVGPPASHGAIEALSRARLRRRRSPWTIASGATLVSLHSSCRGSGSPGPRSARWPPGAAPRGPAGRRPRTRLAERRRRPGRLAAAIRSTAIAVRLPPAAAAGRAPASSQA